MSKEKYFSSFIGLICLLAIFALIKNCSFNNTKGSDYYRVSATFNRIDGLRSDADVRISGIKVGNIKETKLLEKGKVLVIMDINKKYEIPEDSSVLIQTSGMMGAKFLDIRLGSSDEILEDGGIFYGQAQDALVFSDILNAGVEMLKKSQSEGKDKYSEIDRQQ
jgi:phospholipid/cholesterol/gamma-HCH transport system substrate-binding protein